MNKQEFLKLIDKYLEGKASVAEEQLLVNFFYSFEYEEIKEGETSTSFDTLEEKMLQQITAKITSPVQENSRTVWLFSWKNIAAASILILLGFALVYFNGQRTPVQKNYAKSKTTPITPGGNKARLILADGSELLLDDAREGVLATQGNAAIKKTKDGQIIYDATAVSGKEHAAIAYNTISTPKGGQYAIVLPDGSKVWLNAASSLRFPTAFTGKERRVELTGEGYFEIEKNPRMPFKVLTRDQNVAVLGTHFNINCYADEPVIKTTLLEGAVRVSVPGSRNKVANVINLLPGQQSILKAQAFHVKDVNLEEAIAWKNGYFIFTNETIGAVMRKIARWYDVDVEYTGNIPDDVEFAGFVSRFVTVKQVLRKLELTKQVRFKIEGRKIIVMP